MHTKFRILVKLTISGTCVWRAQTHESGHRVELPKWGIIFRAEGALTLECQRRTRSTWISVCSRVTLILGFLEIFDFSLAEMEWVPFVLDTVVGPVCPWIV